MSWDIDRHDPPSADEIVAALARILASAAFCHSPRLAAFLRFVVEAALAGKADGIKGYTIAVEALGRGESFDPHADPIVRVEAGRLRKALASYYADAGADDRILIDLPRGSYVPAFRRRAAERPAAAPVLARRHLPGRLGGWPMAAALAVLVAAGAGAVALTAGWFILHEPKATAAFQAAGEGAAMAVSGAGKGKAMVFVQPFDTVGVAAEAAVDVVELQRKLRDALVRFDGIEVVSRPAPLSEFSAPRVAGRSEYHVAATVEYQKDGATLTFRLHDATAGTIVWARSFENVPIATAAAVEGTARKVATTLAQPYGVIYARELGKVAGGHGDWRHRCMVQAVEARRSDDPAVRARARTCLDAITALDPTHAGGFAALAMLAVREYYEDEAGARAILDRALAAARRAVELKPESTRAHHALMKALFARGEIAAALAEGKKAIALNPNDMTVLAAYGLRLAASGELEKGRAALLQAEAESPARPPMLNWALHLCAYLLGDRAGAAHNAALLTGESDPLALVAQIVEAWRSDDREGARRAIDRLLTLYPGWRNDPRRRLERFIPSSAIVDRLARDLAAAGLLDGH